MFGNLKGYDKTVDCDCTTSINIFWKKLFVQQMFSAQISQVKTKQPIAIILKVSTDNRLKQNSRFPMAQPMLII